MGYRQDSRVYQLIDAAAAAEKMSTIVDILPARESHVRPLLKLENDEERSAVWQSVVEKHGHAITAKDVELFSANRTHINEAAELDRNVVALRTAANLNKCVLRNRLRRPAFLQLQQHRQAGAEASRQVRFVARQLLNDCGR